METFLINVGWDVIWWIAGIFLLLLVVWAIKETFIYHWNKIIIIIIIIPVFAILAFVLYWIGKAIIGFIKYYSQFA